MIRFEYNEATGETKFGELVSRKDQYQPFKKIFGKHLKGQKSSVVIHFLENVLTEEQKLELFNKCREDKSNKNTNHIYYKIAGSILGCSVHHAIKIWNKLEYKYKILPRHDLVMKLGFGPNRKISPTKYEKIVKSEGILRQAVNDKQNNLLPLLFYFGKTPKELRQELGKGLWKSLCKNTFSRNKVLLKMIQLESRAYESEIDLSQILRGYQRLNTTLLKNKVTFMFFDPKYPDMNKLYLNMRENFPMKEIKESLVRKIWNLYKDTQRMFDQCDIKRIALDICLNNIQEVHDNLIEEVNARKYSKDKIEWLQSLPEDVKYLKFSDWEVVLLETKYDVWDEGNSMSHCVASYGESVERQEYLVYSLRKDGKRVSTLGVRVNKKHMAPHNIVSYSYSQHYEFGNKPLKSSIQAFLADVIIERLNREFPEKQIGNPSFSMQSHLDAIEEALKSFESQLEYPSEKLYSLSWNPYAQDKYKSLYDHIFNRNTNENLYRVEYVVHEGVVRPDYVPVNVHVGI